MKNKISNTLVALSISLLASSSFAIGLLDGPSKTVKDTISTSPDMVVNSLPKGRIVKVSDPVSDRYIVALKPGQQPSRIASLLAQLHGGKVDVLFDGVFNGFAAQMSELQAGTMAADSRVRYVEQDGFVKLVNTQRSATWGLDRIDQRELPLNSQYTYSQTGKAVHTYIVDTGVRGSHTEFKGRMGDGYNVAAASPFFEQFLGDISAGLLGGGNNGDAGDTNDCNGHGTHVAGTVAGTDYGVAKQAVVHAVRVLSCDGSGTTSGVIKGVEWITKNHKKPAVANMSLGGGASRSLDEAVANSIQQGITYVVAAGNENTDACAGSPARVPAAITVASSAKNDKRSSFSNKGRCVDIFAPGSDITSAWYQHDRETKTISGTSMAAPHVAGAVALILEANPQATPAAIANTLLANASSGKVTDLGGSPNKLLFIPATVKKPQPAKPAPPESPPGKTPDEPSAEPSQPEPSPPQDDQPKDEQPKAPPAEQQPPQDEPAQDKPVEDKPQPKQPDDGAQKPPAKNTSIGSFAIQCQLLNCTLVGYSEDGSQPQWQLGEGNTSRSGNRVSYQYRRADSYTLGFNQQRIDVEVGDYESTPCSGCDVWQGSVSSEKTWHSGLASIKTKTKRDFYAWVETPDERFLQARLQRKTNNGWETAASGWGNREKQVVMADDMPAGEYRWIVTSDSRDNRFKLWSANSSD